MSDRLDTVIVVGGQAGLAVSHELTRAGAAHFVLERDRIGQSWQPRCPPIYCRSTWRSNPAELPPGAVLLECVRLPRWNCGQVELWPSRRRAGEAKPGNANGGYK